MAKSYRYTSKRRAALRRAQFISAQKRKRNAKIKRVAGLGAITAGGVAAGIVLGRSGGAKDIARSVKNAGAFGKDLASAFKAVDPHKKEQTRRDRVISRKAKKRAAATAATRKNGDRTILKPANASERNKIQREAERKLGPNALDSNTFNRDGTITKSAIVGTHLSDKDIRAGIAQNSRRRAANGGQGMTRAQKNQVFKTLKANQKMMAGKPTTSTISGLKPRAVRSHDPMRALRGIAAEDEKLLRAYRGN